MKTRYVLPLSDPNATLAVAGGKGASLARLASAQVPVPDGFHVSTDAYRRFIEANGLQPRIMDALESVNPDDPGSLDAASLYIRELIVQAPIPQEIVDAIVREYEDLAGELPTVAVRSSATAEDLPDMSFAGQQETYLNVEGVAEVLDAVRKCWASLWTARAIGYRARVKIDSAEVALAVVVQLMSPAQASGIMFTANPVTGRRDQVVINAAWGLGEAIVGGEVTPDTVILEKETGRILERETADKQQMTVRQKNGTTIQSVPDDLRQTAVLDDQAVMELAKLGIQIEKLYETPMDIEWTRANGHFAIVQARPITALPEPEAPTPSGWPMPSPKGKYIRASVIDFIPDPLSPLFRTLGVRMLNEGTIRLMDVEFAASGALPDDYLLTINDYVYARMDFTPRQWFIFLFRMAPGMRKIFKTGITRWLEDALPRYQAVIHRWEEQPLAELTPTQLLDGVRELLEAAIYYLNIAQLGALPLPAQSEMVFTSLYKRLIRKEGDPEAATFLLGYDSKPIRAEKDLYDLSHWVRERPDLAVYLQKTPTKKLATLFPSDKQQEPSPAGVPEGDWLAWLEQFQTHLDEFGHAIYDLDFVNPVPADEPAPLLEMLKQYLSGKGQNPYERQKRLAENREQAVKRIESRFGPIRHKLFNKTLQRAQRLAPLREDCIADIGLGYPRLRATLLELGRRFVLAGALNEAEDIFWIEEAELENNIRALEAGTVITPYQTPVSQRKATWRGEKRVTPPPQLPEKLRILGIDFSSWLPAHAEEQIGNQIKGLGASPGKVTARACVLHGPEDFDQMDPGEVLVATITTPAWTPLFTRASAIVTDIGGPLSHGSIVAREYGIPAVLGTGVATRRIQSGQLITVDGDAGIVTLPAELS